MTKYAKAITAFLTSVVGLFVAYGVVTEEQSQQVIVMLTAALNLGGVFFIPNAKR